MPAHIVLCKISYNLLTSLAWMAFWTHAAYFLWLFNAAASDSVDILPVVVLCLAGLRITFGPAWKTVEWFKIPLE